MIAIVDGGSTKCDWVVIDMDGQPVSKTETIGFNPNIISSDLISPEIEANSTLKEVSSSIKYVYFYGSGCGIQKNRDLVQKELNKVFVNAYITVKEDLTAAAYAAYRGRPEIVCILGTGSNSCYFDGESIRTELPSLGFLIGDEGSGSALGKALVKRYFMKKLPPDLHEEFTVTYQLKIEELLENMYKNPRVNAYMADFTRFIVDRKSHPYFQQLVYNELKEYLRFQILPYKECFNSELNFIGSVAYFFEDILKAVAAEYHLTVGEVVRRPIESLVNYHINYILPKLK